MKHYLFTDSLLKWISNTYGLNSIISNTCGLNWRIQTDLFWNQLTATSACLQLSHASEQPWAVQNCLTWKKRLFKIIISFVNGEVMCNFQKTCASGFIRYSNAKKQNHLACGLKCFLAFGNLMKPSHSFSKQYSIYTDRCRICCDRCRRWPKCELKGHWPVLKWLVSKLYNPHDWYTLSLVEHIESGIPVNHLDS